MARDEQLKLRWETVVKKLSDQFADGDTLDLDAIIYLIGVQELGNIHNNFKKDQKLDLMHIAICKVILDCMQLAMSPQYDFLLHARSLLSRKFAL